MTDSAAPDIRRALSDPFALCSALGLVDGRRTYARQARGITVRCPWHDERTPSCSVTTGADGTVRAKCFGCGTGGDALALIAGVYRLDARRDFREVLRIGADLAGIRLDDGPRSTRSLPPRPPPPPEPERIDDDTFDAIAAVIANECPLEREPDVAAYVRARGLFEAVRGEWYALPADAERLGRVRDAIVAAVGEDAWLRSGLAVGLDREGKPRDRMHEFVWSEHRLVIPWRTPGVAGIVTTVQRRVIAVDAQPGRKYVFATRRPPRWPYGVERLEDLGPGGAVAFVEGAVDAVAMRVLCGREGIERVALGLPGVENWVQSWARLAEGRAALIALDADDAGNKHVERLAADLRMVGVADVKRSKPRRAKDWGDILARGEAT